MKSVPQQTVSIRRRNGVVYWQNLNRRECWSRPKRTSKRWKCMKPESASLIQKPKRLNISVDFKIGSVFTPTLGLSGNYLYITIIRHSHPKGPRRCLNDTDREVSRESYSTSCVVSERNWHVIIRVMLPFIIHTMNCRTTFARTSVLLCDC